ncbi:MAG: hypothetical protein IPK26_14290 [Planctomycetes bacterium]|nr:hypothetical protein [Planctomycetota bacterium]
MPLLFLAIALTSVSIGSWCNRNVRGFLPDDLPRPGRKQHRRPIPLAGVLLAPAVIAALASGGHWLAATAALLAAAIGFVDDWHKERQRDFDWRLKGAVLALAAALIAGAVFLPWRTPGSFALTWVLCFVLINATNFLDNTDGVATALAAVALLLGGGGEAPWLGCGAAAAAFLPWNWPRPRLFLGDSGAFLFGVALATMTTTRLADGWQTLLPVALLLGDFAQVITARLILGVAPWVGDRRHLTHIVQNLGLSRSLVAPLFALVAAALIAAGAR